MKIEGKQPCEEKDHVYEVYNTHFIGMLGYCWCLRCVKCGAEIMAMTAVEFLFSGALDTTPNN